MIVLQIRIALFRDNIDLKLLTLRILHLRSQHQSKKQPIDIEWILMKTRITSLELCSTLVDIEIVFNFIFCHRCKLMKPYVWYHRKKGICNSSKIIFLSPTSYNIFKYEICSKNSRK